MKSLFSRGYRGLSDTIFSGPAGSVYRSVGIDHRSKPGVLQAHQKLAKVSGETVDVLATDVVKTADGKKVWFGGNKAFLDDDGAFSEKLDLSQITRDLLFTTAESTNLGVASSVVRFSEDGTRMYVFKQTQNGNDTLKIRQYKLNTAYDTDNKELEIEFSATSGTLSFYVSETRLFLLSEDTVSVYRIVDWDTQSRQLVDYWDLTTQTTDAIDIAFNGAGTVMYILDASGDIHEYTLASSWGAYPVFHYMLVGGGAGGGGAQGNGTNHPHVRGGVGGGGGVDEDTNAWLAPGVSHSIVVGSGGAGGAAGANDGVAGGDTVAFGLTVKGGGFGSRAAQYGISGGYNQDWNGGDGGNGGGGGHIDDDDNPAEYGRSGNVLGSSKKQVGVFGSGSGITAGASKHVSDVTGTEYTYSDAQPGNSTQNTNGTAATKYGQGGGNGYVYNSVTSRAGGNGFAGIAVVRFKTADVSYSQTGGTVTTVGAETVITWTTAASGTFEWTLSSQVSFTDEYSFPAARAFAVESGRIVFIINDTVVQYTMTGYDLSTAALADNVLIIDTLEETITPRSIVLSEDYAVVGFETLEDTGTRSLTKYKFVTTESDILSAELFTITKTEQAKTPVLFDSFGRSYWNIDSETIYSGNDNPTFDLGEVGDRPATGSVYSAAYVKASSSTDVSVRIRGYIDGDQSGSNISIQAANSIYPNLGYASGTDDLQTVRFDTIMMDSMIVGDVWSQFEYDGSTVVIQRIGFARDTQIDAIEVKLREGQRLNGGYSLLLEVFDAAGDTIATDTVIIGQDDIGVAETAIRFSFTPATLKAGQVYTVNLGVISVTGENFNLAADRYLVWVSRQRGVNEYALMDGDRGDLELQMRLLDTSISASESDIVDEERIYFTTEKMLFYIKTSDISGSWTGKIYVAGTFEKGHTEHHPTLVQGNALFIGDGNLISEVSNTGVFTAQTFFNLQDIETIKALAPFDVDILVGTEIGSRGRVLRWDGLSEIVSAEDIIYEKHGVLTFIVDDNYVYAVAGKRGSIYYYNGAKCEDFITLPGVDGTDSIEVHRKAVGFFLGVPLVGISNSSGNPLLQGVYGYGSYNTKYAKSLSLDYPMPSGEFADVQIGAILVDGTDLYVSWTDGEDTGVAKIDWNAKYTDAYFETVALTNAMNRHQAKTISEVLIPYHQLPANTGVTIGVDKDYAGSFSDMAVLDDTKRKLVKLKSPHIPDTVNPRLHVGLTVSNNTSPEIEDVLFDIAPIGAK